ncbi:hypothetical protein SELR_pSRC102590 (plasmid) [Selenomonas ruminantium subsp. lactilytica TAM6421]|uniref:Uncharacterized protein n=1 Tax=Selenomonas ruminantium subsp. lactilytica (strain NBRC 103574 / TAM6421) TaxID=927704 RepID=I0GWC9_SELRL|nr:hypothetical protein SELR_pSRC102590 [Selenomonas ruminantium subsp. lactilytica TAM6421]
MQHIRTHPLHLSSLSMNYHLLYYHHADNCKKYPQFPLFVP